MSPILFSIFGWLYMRGLSAPSLEEALITGAIWAGVLITLIYLAIFAGPVIGYLFV